jgi:hypothetical protein
MIAGGHGSTGAYRSVYVLDMITGRYSNISSMHTHRYGLRLVGARDRIFAIGGYGYEANMHSMRLCNFMTCWGGLITV